MTRETCNINVAWQNSRAFSELNINFWISSNRNYIEFNYYGMLYNLYDKLLPDAIRSSINVRSLKTMHREGFVVIAVDHSHENVEELNQALQELSTYMRLAI